MHCDKECEWIMDRPTLTVFTPTYNRDYTLQHCYNSLKRQTCKDYVWLIIDDGSTDQTRSMVEDWIAQKEVPIRYHYQKNQGMHGAHNTAYELIDTELNVCIDSDDYLADDAVEKIISFWKSNGSEKYAGIVALDCYMNGEIIGTRLPENVTASTLTDLYAKYKVKGDKKLVYRSELTRACPPYPIFQGEKYVPLSYKYILIDQQCPLLLMNEVLCFVEYLPDGSSLNMIKQYKKNPQGFSFFRKTAMQYAPTWKERFRECVHYVSSSLLSKNYRFVVESPYKGILFLSLPFGIALYLFVQFANRKNIVKTSS